MLKMKNGTPTKITAVNFTFALMGGMWIRDEYGQTTWIPDEQGKKEYPNTWSAWHKIAYHDGWCGMWYSV